jgi:hypothetical protein
LETFFAIFFATIQVASFADTTERENSIKEQFAAAWALFAYGFSDEKGAQEYNGIKHGFRIKTGWRKSHVDAKSGFLSS